MIASVTQLAYENDKVMLLTGDLGFGVFEEFENKFPKQYLNVGVAEQNMIGVASGLALNGRIVYVYSIGNFPTLRCLEQIRNDACYHELNINIIAAGGGFSYGALGMSHHATEDLSILRALPGMTVIAPSTAWEAGEAVKSLANIPGPGYLRIDKSKAADPHKASQYYVGKSIELRKGKDFTIFVAGGIAEEALEAADDLSDSGIECSVISMHTIKPIDVEAIMLASERTRGILVLEENNRIGGLGGAITEVCMDSSILPKSFVRLGMPDKYSSVVGTQRYLRKYYGISKENVIAEILKVCSK